MFLFNLSLAEFLALFTIASSAVVALYLLDRARRKLTVATLRFWTVAERPTESAHRHRIRQWPSLLLQLIAVACLLLALAQLRLGSSDDGSRDHVLIVDRSAWMAASTGNGTLIGQAKGQALAYLRAIPSTDRVMLVAADALATPVTSFESDRAHLEQALRRIQPGNSALDLAQALDFARSMQRRAGLRPGEIVYAGAGRITRSDTLPPADALPALRILPLQGDPQNVGLRKVGLLRSSTEIDKWTALVLVRNYGRRDQPVEVALQFGGAPVGSRQLRLAAGTEQEAPFEFHTKAAGLLEVRIRSNGDAFPQDDRAVLELPALAQVPVTVCSDEPALLRPLFEAHPNLTLTYFRRSACPKQARPGILVFDGFVPDPFPAPVHAILIDPPQGSSPLPVRTTVTGVDLTSWITGHPLAAGMRTQDLHLDHARIFDPHPGDIRVAESEAGPVVVARSSPRDGMLVAVGFHPMRGAMRFELSTPLLFADILRWMAPDSFRRAELYTDSIGSITVPLDPGVDSSSVHVLNERGAQLPFAIHDGELQFFSGAAGPVRVQAGQTEQVHSLALPEVGETVWQPPAKAVRGVPPKMAAVSASSDIWYWLALAAGLLLLFEWIRYAPTGLVRNKVRKARVLKLPRPFRRAS